MKCIYCNTEKKLTSSDIISFAITGAKLTKSFVCEKHNAFTNENYEKKFIADLAFFRNRLGLMTRDGKPIQFVADISIDGTDVHGVKISNRQSLYLPKDVVVGTDDEGKKILMAPYDRLKKFGGNQVSAIDMSDVMLHTTISSDVFIGSVVLHSVAKMAYEWYCYLHRIEEFGEEYKEIVNYILGDSQSSLVEIVWDLGYYMTIDQVSEIGTNSFFEYDDTDGYKYVLFDLWKTVAYRVKICRSQTKTSEMSDKKMLMFELYLYHLDGSKSKSKFGVFCNDNSGKYRIYTLQSQNIGVDHWKRLVQRIEKIMGTKVLSLKSIKQKIDSIEKNLQKYQRGKIDAAQLLEYEENDVAAVLEIIKLLHKNKEKYNRTLSFNENLKLILNIKDDTLVRTIEEKKSLMASYAKMDKAGTLFEYMKEGIDTFNEIYQIAIKRV